MENSEKEVSILIVEDDKYISNSVSYTHLTLPTIA